MKCIAPKIGKPSLLYQFGQLSAEERKHFEAHLLECDHCFQEAYALGPVIEKMRNDPAPFLAALTPAIKPRRKFHLDLMEAIGRIPALGRIAIPAVAIALLLWIIWPATELADLARITPVPYRSLQVKGGSEATAAERQFEAGMAAYAEKNYAGAIERLAAAVRQDSTNAGFHFYLGLCYLLSSNVDPAISHLQTTIALGESAVREKAYWYLGNTWLLKNDRAQALKAFRSVSAMEGDYHWEAKELIGKLESGPR